jgi:hypothetical protein
MQHQTVSYNTKDRVGQVRKLTDHCIRTQLLVEQQDRTLTDIAGTVNLLREQARVIGTEVYEQNT